NDFGYSKTSEETEKIWDREKVLGDIVWVIRKFQPDLIVLRFPPGRGGHGHHSASGTLGVEAFGLAADKTAYPDQLQYVKTWQAKRVVINTGRWWNKDISADDEGVVAEDIGGYNKALGVSYNEMAATSRTMHKSQGFGSTGRRGEHLEYFEHVKGEEAKVSLFDGVVSDWTRTKSGQSVQGMVNKIVAEFNIQDPSTSVGALLELKAHLNKLKLDYWGPVKIAEIDKLIVDCMGLYLEAAASDYSVTPGDSVHVSFELVNRSGLKAQLRSIKCAALGANLTVDKSLGMNLKLEMDESFVLAQDKQARQPYWLEKPGTLGTYKVEDQQLIGDAENKPDLVFEVALDIEGTQHVIPVALINKRNDPVKGELYRPFVITPPVFVNLSEPIYVFASVKQKELEIVIKAGKNDVRGRLSLSVPKGWEVLNRKQTFNLREKGEELKLKVTLKAGANAENGVISVGAIIGTVGYGQSLVTIAYDHIPTQTYFPKAEAQLINVNLTKRGTHVGYIHGAGDVVPEALRNMGYEVDVLEEEGISAEQLRKYSTVVLGIRALNTNERIGFVMPTLLDYVKNGGNLVIQYNTRHRVKTEIFSPYPIKLSRDRVTEEGAEVTFLLPDHAILNTPNKITKADFDGWVQERGLYFPSEWDEKYAALLSWHDEGEEAKTGSLLATEYGKGHFIYTGISFFRELPAGVPGAYRLLANIVSYGNE
ncbi:MAG: LmbE family protein, partial [Flavobacteriales bacterium]|nr:LmbE family protein [Flavobacteriales bacterium]